jgi:exonuclease SbcD
VVVAGDIYDRAVPSADAVELLDWVLTELVERLGTPTLLIAGNHDSPDRLQFGARLLAKHGLHVVGKLDGGLRLIPIGHGASAGFVCPCPFVDPAAAREVFRDESITTHDAALRAMTRRYREQLPTGAPAVLVAHAFLTGASPSDSERPLSVGGADQVALDCFDGFAYTALGHLHSPQAAARPNVRYSGSLLKYSKSEASKPKSVTLVEVDAGGVRSLRELPLVPKHDVRELQGFLADLESGGAAGGATDDYLFIKLLDPVMPVNAMSRLRARFPNVADLDVSTAVTAAFGQAAARSLLALDDLSLFDTFVHSATGSRLTQEERALVTAAIAAVDREVES